MHQIKQRNSLIGILLYEDRSAHDEFVTHLQAIFHFTTQIISSDAVTSNAASCSMQQLPQCVHACETAILAQLKVSRYFKPDCLFPFWNASLNWRKGNGLVLRTNQHLLDLTS